MEDGSHSTAGGGAHGAAALAAHSGAGAGAGAPLDAIPTRGYAMPPPSFRVKREFATWDIDHTRFEVKRVLGKGSYGVVAEAFDHLTKKRVAIKKINTIFDVFENSKRIYREVRILRALQHPYIVKLLHVSCPGINDSSVDLLSFQDLYIVFECVDTDLAKLIKDETQQLTEQHIRWFLYQQLVAVKAMHDARILHRDIKPANVLLSEQCDVKMCDFGLARSFDEENDGSLVMGEDDAPESSGMDVVGGASAPAAAVAAAAPAIGGGAAHAVGGPARQMTRHVQTRWYRAPELPLYNDGRYLAQIDTWSLGCCFAEMLDMQAAAHAGIEANTERRPLFPGGACFPMSRTNKEGKKDQLLVIFENMGRPDPALVARLRTPEAKAMVAATLAEMDRKPVPFVPLEKRYPSASAEALDLLRHLLCFHDESRISLEKALEHPFLRQVKRPPPDFFPRSAGPLHFGTITGENVRALIVEEVRHWNSQIPADWQAVVMRARRRASGQ